MDALPAFLIAIGVSVIAGLIVAGVRRFFSRRRARRGHGITVSGDHNTLVGTFTVNEQGRVHIGDDPPKDDP